MMKDDRHVPLIQKWLNITINIFSVHSVDDTNFIINLVIDIYKKILPLK